MEFDYYFPLFNQLMYGQLNPELPENAESQNYTLRIEQQVTTHGKQVGTFSLHYLKPVNLKCVYYGQLLLSETNLYCEDALEYIPTETDTRIRSFLRDQILDKHLTTCLERIGEKIKTKNYRLEELEHPVVDADRDRLSNIYIIHLLKACVAKAYLEIQEQLVDVVSWKRTEELLYLGVVKELQPIKHFLVKKGKMTPKTSEDKILDKQVKKNKLNDVDNKSDISPNLIDSKQVMKLLAISESGLYRLKKAEKIPLPTKIGKKDKYDEQKIIEYRDSLNQ